MRGLEKPILFNTEMVKAIMEGRKTQTRRIIKKKYSNTDIGHVGEGSEILYPDIIFEIQNDVPEPVINDDGSRRVHLKAYEEIKKPYEIGDILYVRETWAVCSALNLCSPNKCAIEHQMKENIVWYRANGEQPNQGKTSGEHLIGRGKWRPSIHMPRVAARIFLKVTDVRAERLQDITEESALKEGIDHHTLPCKSWEAPQEIYGDEHDDTAVNAFKSLWDNLYKNWDENPWVWVIEFEKCQ